MTTTPNEITIPATDSQALAIRRSIGWREALDLLEGLERQHPGAPCHADVLGRLANGIRCEEAA